MPTNIDADLLIDQLKKAVEVRLDLLRNSRASEEDYLTGQLHELKSLLKRLERGDFNKLATKKT